MNKTKEEDEEEDRDRYRKKKKKEVHCYIHQEISVVFMVIRETLN